VLIAPLLVLLATLVRFGMEYGTREALKKRGGEIGAEGEGRAAAAASVAVAADGTGTGGGGSGSGSGSGSAGGSKKKA